MQARFGAKERSVPNKDCKEQILCQIRQEWVAAHPEEKVRQKLIDFMVHHRGFPAGLIAVEKALQQMPHLSTSTMDIPQRRADVLCFGKGIHRDYDLYPLLLVECKAVSITPKVINQVVGYNRTLQAFFVAVANQEQVMTGWFDHNTKEYTFIPKLPSYEELLHWTTASSL